MTKVILVAFVFVICTWTGFYKSNIIKERYQNLCYIKAALSNLKMRISFFGYDISRALENSAKNTTVEELFKSAALMVEKVGVQKAWSKAVDEHYKELFFEEEDCVVLKMLSTRLGMTDCEGQIKNVDGVCAMLDTNIENAKHKKEKYSSLYLRGGVLVGVFLGLVII